MFLYMASEQGLTVFNRPDVAALVMSLPTGNIDQIMETRQFSADEADRIHKVTFGMNRDMSLREAYGIHPNKPGRYYAVIKLLAAIQLYPDRFGCLDPSKK